MKCNCEPLIKAIDAYIRKADDDLAGALDEAGFIDTAETVEEISGMEERVARALKKETRAILDAAEEAVDLEVFARDVWPGVKADDDVADKLRLIFFEEFNAFMPELVTHYVAKIDADLVVTDFTKRTTAWIEEWSQELGDIMKLNSHDEVEKILATGLEQGQSVAEFTRALQDSGIRDEYYRARAVAVTETLRAHSAAQQEALVQNPAAAEKEWVHTGGNDPRLNHVAMNGQRVPVDEPFVLECRDGDTRYPMFPRDTNLPPEESINCHCIHRGIASEEVLGLSLEERKRLQQEAVDADDGEWEKELDAQNRARAGIE